ncbi:hypothetical protein HAV_00751 [Candidatus Hepatincola sp. Av]
MDMSNTATKLSLIRYATMIKQDNIKTGNQNQLESMILKIKQTSNYKNNLKEVPPSYLQPY